MNEQVEGRLDTESPAPPDTSFSTAFALGGETASLFRGASFDAGHAEESGDANHYLRAGNSLVGALTSTLWRFLRPLRVPLLVAAMALLGGVALLLFTDTVGKVVGALLTGAGAVGITGADGEQARAAAERNGDHG